MRHTLTRLTRRFHRWLDPSAFFSSDASLEIDRLILETERQDEQIKQLERERDMWLSKYLCELPLPAFALKESQKMAAEALHDFAQGAQK